jgi:hypothetical protein
MTATGVTGPGCAPRSSITAASARCEAHLAAQQPKVRLRWGAALILGIWALALVCAWQLFKHLA